MSGEHQLSPFEVGQVNAFWWSTPLIKKCGCQNLVHPLCPFSGRERFVVFVCSVAFNFLWTACTTYNARRVERNVSDILKCKGVCFWWFYFISKHTVTVIYAVLIRQLVICPCLYEPVIKMACGDHTHGCRQESTKDLLSRARKLR